MRIRTNVVLDDGSVSKIVRVQPDAIVCEIDQLSWGCALGYGEAKVAEPNPNVAGLANDLLRLATMTVKSIGGSEVRSVFAFQIHGYNLKVYVTQRMPNSTFYTMVEMFEITFPNSIQEIDLFINRKNIESLISLYKIFWTHCAKKQVEEVDQEELRSPALDISTIQSIKDGCMDRSRECPLKY